AAEPKGHTGAGPFTPSRALRYSNQDEFRARGQPRSIPMIRFFCEPFERAWHYRELIQVILWRELAARFRYSYVSWGWAVFAPLVMLALYTTVFTTTLKVSSAPEAGVGHYALRIFVGLIIFNLTVELMSRAPTLMH